MSNTHFAQRHGFLRRRLAIPMVILAFLLGGGYWVLTSIQKVRDAAARSSDL